MNIRFCDVSFKYDKEPILSKFNLEIKDSSFVVLLGHNGSGKSTIAKLLMGLLPVGSGKIYIDDEEMTEDSVDKLRQKMSIIFQNPDNQFVGVTVKDDIAFGLENRCIERKEMIEKIEYYADKVGMKDYLERNPEQISGGQKQRVAIAGALALETELIIFDESTSMLDPKGVKEVNEMIDKIRKEEHKTILSITHNLDEARFADRVIVLNKGKIVLDGTPEEVFKKRDTLINAGLKTIETVDILHDLKLKNYSNKKEIEDALWELTFKM